MPVQFIKLDSGAELAVLPREEYERLRAADGEDTIDGRAIDDARAAMAAGRLVKIPLDIANAIADGANRIRTFRKWRGLTQADLAAKAGIGQGYLSDLEKGQRDGSTTTLNGIAQALQLPLDVLVG